MTTCAVPDGIFGTEGAGMLRMIAYGNELHLANPPRLAKPSAPWAPDWAVKIRVKSVANAMLGLDMESMKGAGDEGRGKAQGKDEQKPRKKEPAWPVRRRQALSARGGRAWPPRLGRAAGGGQEGGQVLKNAATQDVNPSGVAL